MKKTLRLIFSTAMFSALAFVLIHPKTVRAEDYILGRPMTEEEIREQEDMEPEYMPELPEDPDFFLLKNKAQRFIGDTYDIQGETSFFPSRYDLRELGFVSGVRNQGQYGTCWAFATLASLESNAILSGYANADDIDLSESHLAYYCFHQGSDMLGNTIGDAVTYKNSNKLAYLNDGGNYLYSIVALMNGKGAADESKWGYEPYSDSFMKNLVDSISSDVNNAWNSNSYSLENAYILDGTDVTAVKSALMQYGALYTNMYFKQKDSSVYNASTGAYYNPQESSTNHAIAIVGWDDNYSKRNFSTVPKTDGAWICKNSWGSSWGDAGYFYVSYSEPTINQSAVVAYIGKPTDERDNLYNYSGSASLYSLSLAKSIAQVITADGNEGGAEKVESVGFFVYSDGAYSVQLYKNPQSKNGVVTNPSSGEPLLSSPITGVFSGAGYYTVNIDEEVLIEQGDVISAVVSFDDLLYVRVDRSEPGDLYDCVNNTEAGQTFIYDKNGKIVDAGKQTNPYSVRMNVTTKDVREKVEEENEEEKKSNSITYVLDGGINNPENPDSYSDGEEVVLYTPTKEGYVFNGWCTDKSLIYTSKITRITKSMTGDIILYAKWLLSKYTIEFNGNGAAGGYVASMTGCKCHYDYALPANGYEREGFEFIGWNTEPDGSGEMYAAKEKVRNLSLSNGDTVVLYAQWSGAEISISERYTITYIMDGGINNPENPDSYIDGDEIILYTPTKAGYVFNGWCTDKSLIYTSKITRITKSMTGDIILYAKWLLSKYAIEFNGNGATEGFVASLTSCKCHCDYALPANGFERKGFDFIGWNTEPDGSGEMYSAGEKVRNLSLSNGETVVLFAQWGEAEISKCYTITYIMDGGINNPENPDRYTDGEEVILYTPTKAGYVFNGWCTDKSLIYTSKITRITMSMTGDIILYAKWLLSKYTIEFNGNGATGGNVASLTSCKCHVDYVLPNNGYVREGYEFIGWNTEPDGSGEMFGAKEKIRNLSLINGEVITLYAQWKRIF